MPYNRQIIKNSLDEITVDSFKEAIFLSYKGGITTVAPLGFSGDTILLFAQEGKGRVSHVSIRNYGGDAEMLITDLKGRFIFFGRFDASLGIEKLAFEYFRIFTKVKDQILNELPKRPEFTDVVVSENVNFSEGFKMLQAYEEKFRK